MGGDAGLEVETLAGMAFGPLSGAPTASGCPLPEGHTVILDKFPPRMSSSVPQERPGAYCTLPLCCRGVWHWPPQCSKSAHHESNRQRARFRQGNMLACPPCATQGAGACPRAWMLTTSPTSRSPAWWLMSRPKPGTDTWLLTFYRRPTPAEASVWHVSSCPTAPPACCPSWVARRCPGGLVGRQVLLQ